MQGRNYIFFTQSAVPLSKTSKSSLGHQSKLQVPCEEFNIDNKGYIMIACVHPSYPFDLK